VNGGVGSDPERVSEISEEIDGLLRESWRKVEQLTRIIPFAVSGFSTGRWKA
jgi:hypothetical protein